MSLSDRQRAAVEAAPGGLFVSAAAGSGKTRVLTARFVRLVEQAREQGAARPLDSLVAITFTEKAAGELSQRIRGTLARDVGIEVARDAERAWISTIHGLCRRLLKRHSFEAGLDPAFGVCDEVEAGLLRQQAFELAIRELSNSGNVARLLADYDVAELEMGIRSVDERIRSLGVSDAALCPPSADAGSALHEARLVLRSLLHDMRSLPDRRGTEDKNIDALNCLLDRLEAVDAGDPEVGTAVLGAAAGFKQNKGCRECAKPLAMAAEVQVDVLRRAAAGQASAAYTDGFLELLKRYSEAYELAKTERGVLDFEDLQLKVRDLLSARPDLVRRYHDLLVEVMVDEFQDTNELQLSVVSALAGDVLTTVGDEKQSIYGWRNADIDVFRRRRRDVDGSRVFHLPENYRSHPELVRFFNEMFSADAFWPDDFMRLEVGECEVTAEDADSCRWPEGAPRVQLTLLDTEECSDVGKTLAEARAVAEWFSGLRNQGVRQKELVLLLRAMKRAETFEKALQEAGFDVFVASGGTFFDAPEIEELEALLRVVSNTRDDDAFARVLAGKMANLSDDALFLLRGAASCGTEERRSLWEVALAEERPALAVDDGVALDCVLQAVSDIRAELGRTSLYELIHSASEKLGYDLTLFASNRPRAWANVLKFARLAGEFERLAPGDPGAFLDYLDQRRTHQRYEQQAAIAAEEVDAVRIMSVHSAKGLEFPVVALAELGTRGYNEKRPTFECGSPDGELTLGLRLPDEEPFSTCRDTEESAAVQQWRAARDVGEAQRILYVACTRATEALGLFAVIDSGKEPPADAPIGWVARAIGLNEESGRDGIEPEGQERDVSVGDASVRVRRVVPPARCEESSVDERPPKASDSEPIDASSITPSGAPREGPASLRPARISFTGLQAYRDCPYRYYAAYVARLGRLAELGGPGGPRAVGSAVHQALRLASPETGVSEAQLRTIALANGLGDEGLGRVRVVVERFLASGLAAAAFSAPLVLREAPFAVDVGGTTVDGAIDLLAVSGDSAVVIDYKTGTSAPDAEAIERWRLQAVCYTVAVLEAYPSVESTEVVFCKPELGDTEKTFAYARSDAPALETEIESIISSIAEGAFEPLRDFDRRTCSDCPALGNLCPITAGRAPAAV